jgi:hypothetical protein
MKHHITGRSQGTKIQLDASVIYCNLIAWAPVSKPAADELVTDSAEIYHKSIQSVHTDLTEERWPRSKLRSRSSLEARKDGGYNRFQRPWSGKTWTEETMESARSKADYLTIEGGKMAGTDTEMCISRALRKLV